MHCYIRNIEAIGLMVLEKTMFFSFLHYKSMEANDLWRGANLDPMAWFAGFI